jgi:hypothetical protein
MELELTLTHAEFQGLKKLRKAPIDYRNARFIVEEVFVRQIVEESDAPEIRVGVVLRVDDTVTEVEQSFREELRAVHGWRWGGA